MSSAETTGTPETPEAAPDQPPSAPSHRRGKGYFLPGTIALAALVGIGAFVGAGDLEHPAAKTLDGTLISSQIALGIQAQRNSVDAPQISCPPKEPVRQGFGFDCTMAGRPPVTVHVTELDSRGRISWSLGR